MLNLLSIVLFLGLAGVRFLLNHYGWPWIEATRSFARLLDYRGNIDTAVTVLVGIAFVWLISRIANFVIDRLFAKVLRGSSLARKLLPLLKFVTDIMILGFGTVFILSLVGVNVSALIAGAGVGGLVFALAGKEIASNFLGSLSLIFGKFFKISDRIRIKGFEGTVEEISLSHTKLVDKSGHTVYVPNRFLTAEPIENLSQSEYKSLEIWVSLPAGASLDKAVERISKDSEATVKTTISEIGGDTAKLNVRMQCQAEGFEIAKKKLLERIAKEMAK